jgi:hypothetical protein
MVDGEVCGLRWVRRGLAWGCSFLEEVGLAYGET